MAAPIRPTSALKASRWGTVGRTVLMRRAARAPAVLRNAPATSNTSGSALDCAACPVADTARCRPKGTIAGVTADALLLSIHVARITHPPINCCLVMVRRRLLCLGR